MAFSSNSGSGPMADINVTPLVDVMLVLLIIFMITAPLMSHKTQIQLPTATLTRKSPVDVPPQTIAVKNTGELYFNDEKVNITQLENYLDTQVAQRTPQPQVDIRADANTKYRIIQEVVDLLRRRGIRKVAFVSEQERS
jgi:biopolymer transport protein ExbD